MKNYVSILKNRIDELLPTKEQVIVAIDGNCTAGKTTLAAALEKEYDCNVFHMDDFFLRPEQRTAERYAQSGGNVDYERFWEEVLIPLKKGSAFSYRPFACSTFTLSEPVTAMPKRLHIIEGTYSMHPYFGDVYDLTVFLSIEPKQQAERIAQRPQHLHERFFKDWIPMEKRYFDCFHISDRCDILLDMNS